MTEQEDTTPAILIFFTELSNAPSFLSIFALNCIIHQKGYPREEVLEDVVIVWVVVTERLVVFSVHNINIHNTVQISRWSGGSDQAGEYPTLSTHSSLQTTPQPASQTIPDSIQ